MRTETWKTMKNPDVLKAFGARLKSLRKLKEWSQKDLAAMVGVLPTLINKYECGLHNPPMEALAKLAEALGTSVDFLITGNQSDERPLHNFRLLERFRELENAEDKDKEAVIHLIDAVIVRHKMQGALTAFKR